MLREVELYSWECIKFIVFDILLISKNNFNMVYKIYR